MSRPGYHGEYYAKHSDEMKAGQRARRQARSVVLSQLKSHPCADCGVAYPPYVMDFDHRDPTTKLFCVGRAGRYSLDRFFAEVDKCDLVCANCHRERTHGAGRPARAHR